MNIIWWIGFITISYLIYICLSVIYERWIRSPTDYSQFIGEWALVSGSSVGLGEEFAYGLAKRGLNIILIARSKDKLEIIAERIRTQFKRETRVISVDLTDSNVYEQIESKTRDLNITILVNNVGGPGYSEPFPTYLQTSLKEEEKTHNMNAIPVMRLTRLFLPKMLERKKGRIINVGSLASRHPYFNAIYASDKSKINTFTEALSVEYKNSGVEFFVPNVGQLNGGELKGEPTILKPNPDIVAENSLNLFGIRPIMTVYFIHALEEIPTIILPEALVLFFTMAVFKQVKQEMLTKKHKIS